MSKPSSRKQELRKQKRQKKKEHSAKYVARQQAFQNFPEIVYEVNDAPERLIDAVKQTLKDIVANHEMLFSELNARNFQFMKKGGYIELQESMYKFWLAEGDHESEPGKVSLMVAFDRSLGTLLVSRLPNSIRKAFFPFHVIRIELGKPADNKILVQFLSLSRRKTDGGTVYFAADGKPFYCGDKMRRAAFTRHAIERICERCAYEPDSYAGLLQAFSICNQELLATSCVLPREQLGFALFQQCRRSKQVRAFVEEILGEYDTEQSYVYRVGYGPAVLNDDLAIAKTVLFPGMEGTPEYERILRPSLQSHAEKTAFRQVMGLISFEVLVDLEALKILKLYHDGGIPQVLTMDEFNREFVDSR